MASSRHARTRPRVQSRPADPASRARSCSAFIFVLGNFSLRSGFTIYVDFDYIGSLQPGAPVKVSGIKVGKVEDVEFLGGKPDREGRRQARAGARHGVDRGPRARRDPQRRRVLHQHRRRARRAVPRDRARPRLGQSADRGRTRSSTTRRVHNPPRTDLVVARLYEVLDGVSSVLRDDRDAIKNLLIEQRERGRRGQQAARREPRADRRADRATARRSRRKRRPRCEGQRRPRRRPPGRERSSPTPTRRSRPRRTTMTTLTPSAQALMTDATRVTGDRSPSSASTRRSTRPTRRRRAAGKAGGLIDNVNGMVTDLRAGKGTAGALLARDEHLQRSARADPRPQAQSVEVLLEGMIARELARARSARSRARRRDCDVADRARDRVLRVLVRPHRLGRPRARPRLLPRRRAGSPRARRSSSRARRSARSSRSRCRRAAREAARRRRGRRRRRRDRRGVGASGSTRAATSSSRRAACCRRAISSSGHAPTQSRRAAARLRATASSSLGRDPPTLDRVLQRTLGQPQHDARVRATTCSPRSTQLRARARRRSQATLAGLRPISRSAPMSLALVAEGRQTYAALGGDAGRRSHRRRDRPRRAATFAQGRATIAQLRGERRHARRKHRRLARRASDTRGATAIERVELAIDRVQAAIDKIDPLLAQVELLANSIARGEGSLLKLDERPRVPRGCEGARQDLEAPAVADHRPPAEISTRPEKGKGYGYGYGLVRSPHARRSRRRRHLTVTGMAPPANVQAAGRPASTAHVAGARRRGAPHALACRRIPRDRCVSGAIAMMASTMSGAEPFDRHGARLARSTRHRSLFAISGPEERGQAPCGGGQSTWSSLMPTRSHAPGRHDPARLWTRDPCSITTRRRGSPCAKARAFLLASRDARSPGSATPRARLDSSSDPSSEPGTARWR